MPRRRSQKDLDNEELPWQFELVFDCIAAVASVAFAVIFIWRITGPARDLEAIFGIPVPTEPFLLEIRGVIILLSALAGLKVRTACRRWFIRRAALD